MTERIVELVSASHSKGGILVVSFMVRCHTSWEYLQEKKRCEIVSGSVLQSGQIKSYARPILDNLSLVGSLLRMTMQTSRLKRGIAPLYQIREDQWTAAERARIASQADLVEKVPD